MRGKEREGEVEKEGNKIEVAEETDKRVER